MLSRCMTHARLGGLRQGLKSLIDLNTPQTMTRAAGLAGEGGAHAGSGDECRGNRGFAARGLSSVLLSRLRVEDRARRLRGYPRATPLSGKPYSARRHDFRAD